MKHQESMQFIRDAGIIAIMRATTSDQLLRAADAIREGGLGVIEVTLTTPGALGVIEEAAAKHDEGVLFGAGTVLDAQSARDAILAGAQFIVAPTCNQPLIEMCRRYSIPVMPGAYTPTEILTAWELGADMVKVFPAGVGGPSFIKAVKAPLPQVELVPVGGVNLDTAAAFIKAGSTAVGVGSALINQALLQAGDFEALTERARRFVAEVDRGRRG